MTHSCGSPHVPLDDRGDVEGNSLNSSTSEGIVEGNVKDLEELDMFYFI